MVFSQTKSRRERVLDLQAEAYRPKKSANDNRTYKWETHLERLKVLDSECDSNIASPIPCKEKKRTVKAGDQPIHDTGTYMSNHFDHATRLKFFGTVNSSVSHLDSVAKREIRYIYQLEISVGKEEMPPINRNEGCSGKYFLDLRYQAIVDIGP